MAEITNYQQQILDLITIFKQEPIELDQKYKNIECEEDFKKIKKKYKKIQNEACKTKSSNMNEKILKLLNDLKQLNKENCELKGQYFDSKQEKEKFEEENSKQKTIKNRLEGLYKSLQKQSSDQLENHKKIVLEEKDKRAQLADQFQTRVKEISTELEEKSIKKLQKEKENEILQEKLKEVEKQFQKREKLFEEEIQKSEIESKQQENQLEEKFKFIEDEAQQVEVYQEDLEKAKKQEKLIEEKLSVYLEKTSQFQDIMSKSNDQFVINKKEFDKLQQKIKNLDNSNSQLQNKSEKSNIAIFDMIEEHKTLLQEQETVKTHIESLKKIENQLREQLATKQKN